MSRKRQTHTRRQQEQMVRRQRARARQLAQTLAHAEIQDAVTPLTGTYAAAGDALMTAVAQDSSTPAKVYDAVRNAFILVDQHLTKARSQTPVACRAGCAWSDGQCRIYAIRPLTCRGYHSTDVNACRHAYERQTPISPAVIPQNLLAPAMGMAHGFALGAGEAGWVPTQIDLQTGVLIALETPAATQQWLDGKGIFR